MKVYIVKKGDTLWDIAEKELGNPQKWHKLWYYNYHTIGDDYNLIKVGQELYIPKWKTEIYCLKEMEKSLLAKVEMSNGKYIGKLFYVQDKIMTHQFWRIIEAVGIFGLIALIIFLVKCNT